MNEIVVVESKQCRKCGETKPVDQFKSSMTCCRNQRHKCLPCIEQDTEDRLLAQGTNGLWRVYEVTGPDGVYIGSARNYKKRWAAHRTRAKCNAGPSPFQRAIQQHGIDAFEFRVLCTCRTREDADARERAVIAQRRAAGQTLYNSTDGGKNGSGWRPTTEQRLKLSAALKGKPKKITAERRAQIVAVNKSRVWTPEARERIAAAKRGKKHSAEHNAKIAAAGIGRRPSTESIAKVVAFHTGRKREGVALENIRKGALERTGPRAKRKTG